MATVILLLYLSHIPLKVAYATLGSDGTATLSSGQIPVVQSIISTASASDVKVFLAGMVLPAGLPRFLT